MKRTFLIILSLMLIMPWILAVQYPTYRPQYKHNSIGGMQAQSQTYSSTAVSPYWQNNKTPSQPQQQWGSISNARNLNAVGSTTPQRVEAMSGDMQPFAINGGPKFAPPGGEGGGTGNEKEPDPTKIQVPIGNGMLFVLFLSIIMLIIKYLKDEKKLLFPINGNVD